MCHTFPHSDRVLNEQGRELGRHYGQRALLSGELGVGRRAGNAMRRHSTRSTSEAGRFFRIAPSLAAKSHSHHLRARATGRQRFTTQYFALTLLLHISFVKRFNSLVELYRKCHMKTAATTARRRGSRTSFGRGIGSISAAIALALFTPTITAQTLSPDVRAFVRVDTSIFALTHVRVIDGTGAAARDDATIIVVRGKVDKIGGAGTAIPAGAQILDLRGYSVIPGLVGMHDHLFYTSTLDRDSEGKLAPPGQLLEEQAFSFPRLYLASGVTSIRTTGSIETYTD